jgi:hypothetical protein
MKPFKLPITILAIMVCLLVAGCSKHEPGVWKNDEIASRQQNDFHEMNANLLDGLRKNKPGVVENMMSKELLQNQSLRRTIELCSVHMRAGKNAMLDEYYAVHDLKREQQIKSPAHGLNSYSLNYQPATREMYVALYTLHDGPEKWLLTAVYNKLDYGWRLTDLDLNPYTTDGKTTTELYEQAIQKYKKGYLIDALSIIDLARVCSMPNMMWRYKQQPEIDLFYSRLMKQIDEAYPFPLVIEQVPTQPKIFRVFNQNRPEGSCPMIYYTSKYNVNDSAAVKKEHEEVKKVIGQVIPGINQERKYVYYTVFNGMPDWKSKKIPHLEIRDVL